METEYKEYKVLDLPSGWMFGFPKIYARDGEPIEDESPEAIKQFAVENGYPPSLIVELDDVFWWRFI